MIQYFLDWFNFHKPLAHETLSAEQGNNLSAK